MHEEINRRRPSIRINGEDLFVFKEQRRPTSRDSSCIWMSLVLLIAIVVLLCLGVGLGLGLFFIYDHRETVAIRDKFSVVAISNLDVLKGKIDLIVKGSASIRSFMSLGYESNYTQSASFDEFLTFTSDPEATLLPRLVHNWDVARLITDQERDEFELFMRRIIPNYAVFDLDENGEKVIAPRRKTYMPIAFINPVEGNLFIFGFDVLFDPLRSKPVIKSSRTKRSSLSSRIRLFADKSFAELLVFPIFTEKFVHIDEPRVANKNVGCLISVIQIRNLVEGSMHELLSHNLACIRVFDMSEEDDDLRILYSSLPHEENGSYSIAGVNSLCGAKYTSNQRIRVSDREWLVCMRATTKFVHANDDARKTIAIVCSFVGALLSIVLAILIILKISSTKKIHRLMRHKVVLLEQIMPRRYVERIIAGEHNIAELQQNVCILFMDIVGFTAYTTTVTPKHFIGFLNDLFSDIDALIDKYQLEKIKTIGDCYMITSAIGGGNTPAEIRDRACIITDFALEVVEYCSKRSMGDRPVQFRVGIHLGDAICGVIGKSKFAYDLWGNNINFASRMESTGVPMRVHVSAEFHSVISENYDCEERGLTEVKGRGTVTTYFVIRKKVASDATI